MHPDDESKTTLSKWPFVLGDVLLVAMAMAIAVLGDWQLTNWQVASCVLAVALGAGLFVLPYLVEFRVRVAEESEDRRADLRLMARRFESLELFVDALEERVQRAEHAVQGMAAAGTPEDALQTLASELREESKKTKQQQEVLARDLAQLKAELLEQIQVAAEAPGQISAKWEEKFSALETRFAEARQLAALDQRLAGLEQAAAAVAASKVSSPEPPRRENGPVLERPAREPRVRHRPDDQRLLNRAINEKQESAASAVSRIIESKGNSGPKPEAAMAAPSEVPDEKVESLEAAEAASTDLGDTVAEAFLGEADRISESEDESLVEVGKEAGPEKPPVLEPSGDREAVVDEPSAEAAPPVDVIEAKTEAEVDRQTATDESAPSGFLFDEDPAPPAPKKTRIKKEDTVVMASVFIGIGNKPYVRGSGAGLSWERGQAMEFQEIGKWRWLAPADVDEPIELQIFRNDEDADRSGKYQLQPGQKLELSPVF